MMPSTSWRKIWLTVMGGMSWLSLRMEATRPATKSSGMPSKRVFVRTRSLYPVVVIPIASDAGRNTGGEHALETMAHATGGKTFYPAGADELDEAFSNILRELRTQYLLGYYPRETTPSADKYHRVSVEVREPHVKITTRTGYYEQ